MPKDLPTDLPFPPAGSGPNVDPALLAANARALAKALNIPLAAAKKAILQYMSQNNGVSVNDATVAIDNQVTGTTTTTTSNTTSSGGGSSSGGSSSGSSSGPTGPTPQQIHAAEVSYANMLQGWGIPVDKSMEHFIAQEVASGKSSQEFLADLRQTKAYAQAFPGIMRPDGTLRMSEAQYIAGYQQARDFASTVGRNLTIHMYGFAIKNGNSPSEIRAKIQAVDVLKENKDVMQNFSQFLLDRGIATPKEVTQEGLLKFVMGVGPKQWETEWRDAQVAAQIENVGLADVGKGGDINWKTLNRLIKNAGPGVDVTKINWSSVAPDLIAALGASRLYDAGLTKKDMVKLMFGGKAAPALQTQVQRVLGTFAAAQQSTANPQLVQGQTGTQLLTGAQGAPQATE